MRRCFPAANLTLQLAFDRTLCFVFAKQSVAAQCNIQIRIGEGCGRSHRPAVLRHNHLAQRAHPRARQLRVVHTQPMTLNQMPLCLEISSCNGFLLLNLWFSAVWNDERSAHADPDRASLEAVKRSFDLFDIKSDDPTDTQISFVTPSICFRVG